MGELSPELLAAREQLLDGIVAAGKLGSPKKSRQALEREAPGKPLREVTLDAVKNRVEQYRRAWVAKRVARERMLAGDDRLPDHYWQDEHRARALYGSALALLEALGGDVHNGG